MRTHFMASAKQIAWRKKFARMAKSGKFKKGGKKSTYVKDVLAEQKGGKIGGGTSAMSLVGQYKTTDPKRYPAFTNVKVKLSKSKNNYLPLEFTTGRNWNLESIAGMKDLIRRFKLKKI